MSHIYSRKDLSKVVCMGDVARSGRGRCDFLAL